MVGLDVVLQTMLVLASNVALAEMLFWLPLCCTPTDHRACVAIGFHFVVSPEVLESIARSAKAPATLVAFVRRFARVYPIVYCETRLLGKTPITGLAFERLFTGVGSRVAYEITL